MKRKLNVIDWIFIIAAFGGVAMIILFFRGDGLFGKTETDNKGIYEITYYSAEVADFVCDSIGEGDRVSDDGGSKELGVVSNVYREDARVYVTDGEGNLVSAKKEGYSSLFLMTEAEAESFENGVIINGTRLGIGHTMVVRAGKAKIYMTVYDINESGR